MLSLLGCGPRETLQDGPETLQTADGVQLSARRYSPPDPAPPGLILVHRAGGDRRLWHGFAVRAQQWGYLVLSLDLRGHGESKQSAQGSIDHRRFSADDWQRATLDIDAALARLIALGANPEDLFVAGECFGANLALQYTLNHRNIQGVVLLSPGRSYHGIEALPLIEALQTRPTLLMWSKRDDYAASTAAALQQRAPGHLEVRVYPGSGMGVDIFAQAPEAMGQVLVWLDQMRAKPQ